MTTGFIAFIWGSRTFSIVVLTVSAIKAISISYTITCLLSLEEKVFIYISVYFFFGLLVCTIYKDLKGLCERKNNSLKDVIALSNVHYVMPYIPSGTISATLCNSCRQASV